MKIPIIILAAGASRRLGRPKQLELIKGMTLLDNTISSAHKSGLGDVIVILGSNKDRIVTQLHDLHKMSIFYNPNWMEGMGSSIAFGLQQLKTDDYKAVIISVCDQPFISTDIFKRIGDTFDGKLDSIVVSKYKNGFGPPTLFGKKYFAKLKKLTDDEGGKSIIYSNKTKVTHCLFEHGDFDIDDQIDLDLLNV